MKVKDRMFENVEQYGSRSSIHGVSYTLDQTLPWPDRLLWLLLFTASIALSGYMISKVVLDWQQDPTITTLESNSASVDGLDFPTVTVCGPGRYMENVQKGLYKRFVVWKANNSISNEQENEESFREFLRQVYQTKNGSNIMNLLSTMTVPSPEKSKSQQVVRTAQACSNQPGRRKKRSAGSTGKNHERFDFLNVIFNFYLISCVP